MAAPKEFSGMLFQKGDRVRTADKLSDRDFLEEVRATRQPGKTGVVCDLSNSHGLCFYVRYDGGGSGWFDPDELTRMPSS